MIKKILHLIRKVAYAPISWPAILAYYFSSPTQRNKINADIDAYWVHTRGSKNEHNYVIMLYDLLIVTKEFRNVYYCRLHLIGRLIQIFLKPIPSLFINSAFEHNYAGGLYISHGTSCRIGAESIGKNLWCHHNTTFGLKGTGRPKIGDNVYIGTGVVIVGGVTIGNNVKIGANATIVDDVPDNAVVVSPKAKVVKILAPHAGGG